MATANAILKIAKAELDTMENPANSNKVKYNTWYYGREVSGPDYPWCMTFVQWIFNQGGMALGLKTASCTELMNYAKTQNQFVKSGFKPGDIVFYQFDSDAAADHTGIVESVTSTEIVCIEGNTSVSGSQSNGGKVCRQTRKLGLVLGAYRPNYETMKISVDPAKSFNRTYAKTYTVTASALNMRTKAATKIGNSNVPIIKALPKGAKVTCYGYYTKTGATVWLYVKDSDGNVGFCSKKYLK